LKEPYRLTRKVGENAPEGAETSDAKAQAN
jgi:hypothetical protein